MIPSGFEPLRFDADLDRFFLLYEALLHLDSAFRNT